MCKGLINIHGEEATISPVVCMVLAITSSVYVYMHVYIQLCVCRVPSTISYSRLLDCVHVRTLMCILLVCSLALLFPPHMYIDGCNST